MSKDYREMLERHVAFTSFSFLRSGSDRLKLLDCTIRSFKSFGQRTEKSSRKVKTDIQKALKE